MSHLTTKVALETIILSYVTFHIFGILALSWHTLDKLWPCDALQIWHPLKLLYPLIVASGYNFVGLLKKLTKELPSTWAYLSIVTFSPLVNSSYSSLKGSNDVFPSSLSTFPPPK
jgi:hypothetical protein